MFNDGTGDALYIGGLFTVAGDTVATSIAKWEGSNWSAVGTGVNGSVRSLAVFDDGGGPALYAGGYLTTAGGIGADHIAKWDGSSWSPVGTGTNSRVDALAVFDDGSGPALYVGGSFTTAGALDANYIAKWDGSNWSSLGTGMNEGGVLALKVFDDGTGPALYAGGWFTHAGDAAASGVAKWDGSTWSSLGSGMDGGSVYALAVFDDGDGPALYAGGSFNTAGGVSANRVAKWDGSMWSPLGTGTNAGLFSLTVFDDGGGPSLYVGGAFTIAGGESANNIAKWDGSRWSPVGTGTNGRVDTLAVFDDGSGPAMYTGGKFTSAGGVGVTSIARWDGVGWSSLGIGINGPIYALTAFDNGQGPLLFAGGFFTSAGAVSASRIASWNGANWSPVGSGMDASIRALTAFDDGGGPGLYVGGGFTIAGGESANRIAKWDGTHWSALRSGMDGGSVYALAVFDDGSESALYVGGTFTTAGGAEAVGIAKWDGSTWSPLTPGIVDRGIPNCYTWVGALEVFDDGSGPALYVGGQFYIGGGVEAYNIAKWDGSAWSPLGTGIPGCFDVDVSALTVFDDGSGPALYAGGNFYTAGDVGAIGIAKWNGSNWSSVGTGWYRASSFATFDDGTGPALYAGGLFTTAGGISATGVAKWDGSEWSVLGTGMEALPDPFVNALTVFDDGSGPALYAGGKFTFAESKVSANLAKWGPTWGEFNGEPPFDLSDWPGVVDCLQGPSIAHPGECACADSTRDTYVDLRDIAALQIAFHR